ncbi:acyl-CoA carboxylase subunit beta [Rhodopila sp.]|jgi:acetyl-CoA carboxylase carboxyltransferase component|uniref:acyl-CoA carboxylase subunit beta n=1 Tax=Rhodopila sp. TaxID=2480087 RepID=UPI002BE0866C|nr:carboxyl transferase domain-containing protein [Rhodopila sp.]HVZ10113.1 carboxyl transferase domain-containing protein [Rhodopila sp.]
MTRPHAAPAADWRPELEELAERQSIVRRMGGAERVARQHAGGRLTVRERIDRMLDHGSFLEIGSIAGKGSYDAQGTMTEFLPANGVFGRGTVDGRPVVIYGDDFTVRGGSADASIKNKYFVPEKMAGEFRIPLIRMIEGSGGGGSVKTIETRGHANLPGGIGQSSGLWLCAQNMGRIPVVTMGLGSVAGLGAARLAASHYSLMVKDTSAIFVAGPPVVERLGEKRTKQQLGGHHVQVPAGTVDDAVDTEEEAFDRARRFLSYLPSSVWDLPPRQRSLDSPERRDPQLISIVPKDRRKAYSMRRIIEAVMDRGSFFEMGRHFGRQIITGFARLDGWPVAVLAGDPLFNGGAWGAAASRKITRFVDLAQTFHLPVVHLVDCFGFAVGLEAESTATMRHAVTAISAIHQSTVPWAAIIIRNVFGVGGGAHVPHTQTPVRYAWPSGNWGSLPLEGGVEAAYRAEIDAADDPPAKLREIEERLERMRSPFRSAEAFIIDEIIDPRDTRPLLCQWANMAAPLRTPGQSFFTMRP